ncbi:MULTISPECIES: hypothetical protein [unclassified Candidatus Tisiphia]
MKFIVNLEEFGARSDGATPISNSRVTVTTSPTSYQLTISHTN